MLRIVIEDDIADPNIVRALVNLVESALDNEWVDTKIVVAARSLVEARVITDRDEEALAGFARQAPVEIDVRAVTTEEARPSVRGSGGALVAGQTIPLFDRTVKSFVPVFQGQAPSCHITVPETVRVVRHDGPALDLIDGLSGARRHVNPSALYIEARAGLFGLTIVERARDGDGDGAGAPVEIGSAVTVGAGMGAP